MIVSTSHRRKGMFETPEEKIATNFLKVREIAKEVADDLEEIALRLTTLYLEQERFDQVLAWQNEEVETVVTRWNIARALAALEKTEEAVSAYQELYEDLKDNPEFLEAYVYLLREAGDVTKAREVANQYLAIVPDDVQMQTLYDSL